jgi:hypothetical protein
VIVAPSWIRSFTFHQSGATALATVEVAGGSLERGATRCPPLNPRMIACGARLCLSELSAPKAVRRPSAYSRRSQCPENKQGDPKAAVADGATNATALNLDRLGIRILQRVAARTHLPRRLSVHSVIKLEHERRADANPHAIRARCRLVARQPIS